ncbi:hypothetical protein ACLMJK_006600 [Lecanora helva]
MAEHLSNDADPTGDLLLLVGPSVGLNPSQNGSIRVSSKVLSLASPVFATMMSPKFAEGQNAGKNDWTISPPDDDPEAMSVICSVIHFVDVASEVSFSILEKIATICDKYDFAKAIKGWSESALQPWKYTLGTDRNEYDECVQLLGISYLLGNHELFWVASRNLMFSHTVPTMSAEKQYESAFAGIPEGLLRTTVTES